MKLFAKLHPKAKVPLLVISILVFSFPIVRFLDKDDLSFDFKDEIGEEVQTESKLDSAYFKPPPPPDIRTEFGNRQEEVTYNLTKFVNKYVADSSEFRIDGKVYLGKQTSGQYVFDIRDVWFQIYTHKIAISCTSGNCVKYYKNANAYLSTVVNEQGFVDICATCSKDVLTALETTLKEYQNFYRADIDAMIEADVQAQLEEVERERIAKEQRDKDNEGAMIHIAGNVHAAKRAEQARQDSLQRLKEKN